MVIVVIMIYFLYILLKRAFNCRAALEMSYLLNPRALRELNNNSVGQISSRTTSESGATINRPCLLQRDHVNL